MKAERVFFMVGSVFLSVFLFGCYHSNHEDIGSFERPSNNDAVAENYILQPPDEVEIHCTAVPELHLQRQRIRPDGKVSFEGIGEVHAAGKTCEQLSDDIREKVMLLYALTGERPVDVQVAFYQSHYYYVLGEVYFPGPKVCTGRDTVMTALTTSRPTVMAWKERVLVMRPSENGKDKAKMFEFNYKKMEEEGDTSKNVLLQEGDIICVPPTVLASAALVVEEFVRPIGRAFSTVNIVQAAPTSGN